MFGQGVIYKSPAAPLDSSQWTSSDTHTTMMVNNMVYGNGKYVASGAAACWFLLTSRRGVMSAVI